MKLKNLKRTLTENVGIKLLALFVALSIWFSASGQQEATGFFVVPIEIVNLPDSLTIVGSYPKEAEISISGTKRELLSMGFRRIKVLVNLAAAAPGRFRQRLSASNVLLRGGMDPRNVHIISPSAIDLLFERVIERRVPVKLTITGSVPSGYVLMGAPEVEPSEISVRGPSSFVERTGSIATKPVDLNKAKESLDREVELEYDMKTYRCEPSQVRVRISISQRGSRVLANIPPTILSDAPDLVVEVHPKAVSLKLEGPLAVLDTLSTADVSILLDLSGRPAGSYTLSPEIIVPNGVERYSMSVDSLRVILHREQESK